jgi:hypothetical protein
VFPPGENDEDADVQESPMSPSPPSALVYECIWRWDASLATGFGYD